MFAILKTHVVGSRLQLDGVVELLAHSEGGVKTLYHTGISEGYTSTAIQERDVDTGKQKPVDGTPRLH
jgi:hypothetical protein